METPSMFYAICVREGTGDNTILGPFNSPEEAFSAMDEQVKDGRFADGGQVVELAVVDRPENESDD
jgi:hypothetical protein